MECPDPKCRETLLACINKKVSKMVLISVISVILAFGGGFILYAMEANKGQGDKINQNEKDLAVFSERLDTFEATQDDMKKAVDRIEQRQITKQDLIDIVKELRRGD